jgi:response regulator NasT
MADGVRVLIGEDEPPVAEALQAALEGLGYSVAGIAHDGIDALAKAEALDPHLILLDIRMPQMDGVEAAGKIMARRPVPIILLTAYAEPDLIEGAAQAGVMAYLVKPFKPQELAAAIRIALARFADLLALRRDVGTLQEALLLRRRVEQAKGILVQRMRISEAEGHKRLQQFVRQHGCTVGEAADRVIAADKFFADLEKPS